MINEFDMRMMALALRIGERGRPSPNPHVGAVIARDGAVLATGYHHRAGEAHAEVDALRKLGGRADGGTLYVTLEPCNHHGRTGPCSEAVIASGVWRVVIGCEDRSGQGHGGGAERLLAAGIEVEVGVRRAEAEALVADYYRRTLDGRPYVTLKAAATLDGRTATRSGDSRWISNEASRKHAHRMRDRSDAVMVGVGTVLADDPELTVRDVKGRDPVRVVLDSGLLTPETARVLSVTSTAPTLIFHAQNVPDARREALLRAGAQLIAVPQAERGLDLHEVLRELARRDVVRLLVEGGPTLHGSLLDAGLADRVAVFVAPRLLNDAGALPLSIGRPRERMLEALALHRVTKRSFGDDVLIEGVLHD
ncbi:MAG: Diamino hydroxyphosphoribosyl aminopyrimidine deaminase [Myxococcaceae bacterium]|nr:Diamino hydroxyphosphoribosyl aminopyrimidine deaminase [Myxococcaceae bacterium]